MTYVDETLAAEADEKLDVTGLICPEPLMVLRNRVRNLPGGTRVYVVATDPSTKRDFESFCRFLGHDMQAYATTDDGYFHFVIAKGKD